MEKHNFTIHRASEAETKLYRELIYPAQDKILKSIFSSPELKKVTWLTGGTALSRFYLYHRFSEDIDLFSLENISLVFPLMVKKIEGFGGIVDVKTVTDFFARAYVRVPELDNATLKMDVVREVFRVGNPVDVNGVMIDSIENIATNKITAFEDRAEIKDVVDLMFILESFDINMEKIFEFADYKRKPIPYESLLTFNTLGITGSAVLVKDIPAGRIESFISHLKKAVEDNIKKKVVEVRKKKNQIIEQLLWDFPRDNRRISSVTAPVIQRRMKKLPLPERIVIAEVLDGGQG